jgi:hypothetical protein
MAKQLQLRLEWQRNPVADEVSALTAVVRPILQGVLFALKQDVVQELGGYQNVKLKMLPRLYRPGDGDCGICFEYAVHDAIRRGDDDVLNRLVDAMHIYCKVQGNIPQSILFGAEKTGALQLINTSKELLTEDSLLLYGSKGPPVKLKRHIDSIATAFRKPSARPALPYSISGLWKADLFLGFSDTDYWVGTTVKINADNLEAARGLRIGIVPSRQGASDSIIRDDKRKLIVCPLPHDRSFMEIFYQSWGIVQQFIAADANLPREVALPRPPERQVVKYLIDRKEFPVIEVIEALRPLAQPELLETTEQTPEVVSRRDAQTITGSIIAPMPKINK